MPKLTSQQIKNSFNRKDLTVFTNAENFQGFLKIKEFENHVLLLMSSGNYGGLNFEELKGWI